MQKRKKAMRKKKISQKAKHSIKPQPLIQEDDWEKELEEISQRIEIQKQPPYDPKDDLITEDKEKIHCNIQNGPSSIQGHYSPAVHHIQPVKWVRHAYKIVDDQFADAEE